MQRPFIISLKQDADVREAATYTSAEAAQYGFSISESAELALAVSEIAQNVVRYASEGEVAIYTPYNDGVFKVVVSDKGPGIEDLDQAMAKGFSSLQSSLGIGLGVAERSVDEFDISTSTEQGTVITLKKFLPISADKIDYGVVSVADDNYPVNGDQYLIKEFDGDKVLLAVIDGVGEGYQAHAASVRIKEYISKHYRLPLEELISNCHNTLKSSDLTRGAALAVARIDHGQMEYLSVGDTHAYLLGETTEVLLSHEGTVGEMQLPGLKARSCPIVTNQFLIMCTDGIQTNIDLIHKPAQTAQDLASSLFKQFHKAYGDVTVLTTKILAN